MQHSVSEPCQTETNDPLLAVCTSLQRPAHARVENARGEEEILRKAYMDADITQEAHL